MAKTTTILILGACLVAATGCAKKRGLDDIPRAPIGSRDGGGAGDGQAIPGSQADFIARVASDRVYFDTDRSNIDADDQRILASQAEWLKRYTGTRVTIEGHCDERGTRDYNIALGARRANSAKNFLVAAGIDPARINTVSYGKERPDAVGSDQGAWARNRRAVTVTLQ